MSIPTAQTHTPPSALPQGQIVDQVSRQIQAAQLQAQYNKSRTASITPNVAPSGAVAPSVSGSYSPPPLSASNPPVSLSQALRGGISPTPISRPTSTYLSQALSQGIQPASNVAPSAAGRYVPPVQAVAGSSSPLIGRLGGGSGIAAKNAAAAAGATGAQAAAAARISPIAARQALQAAPIVGSGVAGVFAAGTVRAAGGSWGEAALAGVGASIGATIGQAVGLGVAAGALGLGNPFIAAAAPIAGALGGAAIGGELGRRTPSILGRIPGAGGALANLAGAVVPGAGLLYAGAGLLNGWLQPGDVAGPGVPSPTELVNGPVPFTGGQGVGVCYRVNVNSSAGDTATFNTRGPVGGVRGVVVSGGGRLEVFSRSDPQFNLNSGCFALNTAAWRFTGVGGTFWAPPNTASITSVVRTDGQPDTDGNPPPTQVPQPATRPRTTAPTAVPSAPGNLPTPTAPAPNNDASQTPAIRPKAPPVNAPAAPYPGPSLPAGDPLADPAANQDPTAAPNAAPTNVPSRLPNPETTIQPALQPGQVITLPSGTTITGTETGYKISSPTDSPNSIKLPNGQTLLPGEEESLEGGIDPSLAPLWAIPALAISGLLKTPTATTGKIANPTQPGNFTQAPPPTPTTPIPGPPDSGCRCNGPILAGQSAQAAGLADIKTQLARMEGNQTGPQGFGGIYALLIAIQTKLNAVGAFAETAWKSTKMQKVLDVLTFIGVMHNVSMLSREVGETFFYLIGQGLDIVGIDDEEGNPLNPGAIVGDAVENYVRRVFGDVFVDGAVDSYRKANRIVQSASMVIWTIRSIQDSSLDLMEWVAENTGKIGNALKRFGVVGDRSYPWMSEQAQARERSRARFSKLTDTLENAEDRLSSYTVATSTILETGQEVQELRENWVSFKGSLNEVPNPWFDNEPVQGQVATETAASQSPNITATDTQKTE